jgi:hypothetical protein
VCTDVSQCSGVCPKGFTPSCATATTGCCTCAATLSTGTASCGQDTCPAGMQCTAISLPVFQEIQCGSDSCNASRTCTSGTCCFDNPPRTYNGTTWGHCSSSCQ